MNIDIIKSLFNTLDMVVMIHNGLNTYTVVGAVPSWFKKVCPESCSLCLEVQPEDLFPFLGHFMVDARQFWQQKKNGRLRSGIWLESDFSGNELALEASAVYCADTEILLIESCQYGYSEKQRLIQTGRQLALDYHQKEVKECQLEAVCDELENSVQKRSQDLSLTSEKLEQEIIERKHVLKKLKESENRFQLLFEHLFDAQIFLMPNGRIEAANKSACRLLGCDKDILLKRSISDLFSEADMLKLQPALNRVLQNEIHDIGETRVVTDKGKTVSVEAGGVCLEVSGQQYMILSLRDISNRKRLQVQLQQAQKMEAIGSLASGIAHDFNNILSAIIGYTEIVIMDMEKETAVRKNLEQVLAAGDRAKKLVQQILTFSRQRKKQLKPVSMDVVAGEALKLMRALLPSNIRIHQHIEKDVSILGDSTQIHQVCVNLFTNAGHAMQDTGGTLNVRMATVQMDAEQAEAKSMKTGRYVHLQVADSGMGISPELIQKIFDPFFTTKALGKGTGMGLSVAHGIIQKHKGAIVAESQPGEGTVFHVYLPVLDRKTRPDEKKISALPRGDERILFVDDERFQVDMAKQVLERLGYIVEARTSSLEALALFKNAPDAFDLVITDLTMPIMTGKKLAGEILHIRPDTPIILSSGFSEAITRDNAREFGFRDFLNKPIVTAELAKAIRDVLDGR